MNQMVEEYPLELIVGLGNPGRKYENTRHNVGFLVIDHLATTWKCKLQPERKFLGIYGEVNQVGVGKFRLFKPTTYMNLSGQAVRAVVNWYQLPAASVLIIYDDMDLPFGKVRLRASGSPGSHNGMKSITSHLGTKNVSRLRIGIGSARNTEVVDYVLGTFSSQELTVIPSLLRLAEEIIIMMKKEGISKAMSLYNSHMLPAEGTFIEGN